MTHRRAHWQGSRRGLLGFAGAGGLLLLVRGTRAFARSAPTTSLLGNLRVGNGGRPFAGDRPLLATVGGTDRTAHLSFTLARRATVSLAILETGQGAASERPTKGTEGTLQTAQKVFGAGDHTVGWTPAATLAPRTYIARISARSLDGKVETKQAVVRLVGIDAAFAERSAASGSEATLVVRTDAAVLTVQMLRSGPEGEPTYANNVINGVAVGVPFQVDWSQNAGAPAALTVPVGNDWPSGVYAAQITGDDGRRGYAPLVVRPAAPQARVAVVMPTSTWAAYNFYDEDGDGWGDTWYAHWRTQRRRSDPPPLELRRSLPVPQLRPRLPALACPDRQARRHHERRGHRAVRNARRPPCRLRLARLPRSHRVRDGARVRPRRGIPRQGRQPDVPRREQLLPQDHAAGPAPDAASTSGATSAAPSRRCSATSTSPRTAASAGRRSRSSAPTSPRGRSRAPASRTARRSVSTASRSTRARRRHRPRRRCSPTIPDLFGPGRTAEMTYYEHWSGAKVFSAGALDFGGQMLLWPATRADRRERLVTTRAALARETPRRASRSWRTGRSSRTPG